LTFKPTDEDVAIKYGTGFVAGKQGFDTVCVERGICAQNVSMLVVQESEDL
jgi:hypothetical protein